MTTYNRFDPADNFEAIDFRADRVLQSAELNELQSMARHRLQSITDLLYKDGDVVRDARIIVNQITGATTLEAGAVYVSGAVRGVSPASLVIPVEGTVVVGLYLRDATITELEDPTLLNPAVGVRGYREPGASRLQITPEWGVAGGAGSFYPVYFVDDGVVRAKAAPPQLDSVTQAIADYDRRSTGGGSYVIHGLAVARAADLPDGRQVYTVSEGSAQVNGYAVTLQASRRVIYDPVPNLRHVAFEPHASTTAGAQRINFDLPPSAGITSVSGTAERTVTLTHGAFNGAADPLPDTGVLELREVKQGATVYVIGTNVKLTGGAVDWSLPGAEPAPGSTYQVTYRYQLALEPTDVDAQGFTVTGAVPGTLVQVSYNQMLPRLDRMAITPEGQVIWVKGIAAAWNPLAPKVPAGLLALATITQRWTPTGRLVENDGVRVVPMADWAAVIGRLDRTWSILAQNQLRDDIHSRESAAKKGLFVDPFLDDSMRDAGVLQSGAIITLEDDAASGVLTLPIINAIAAPLGSDVNVPTGLAFALDAVLSQTLRTDSMKVNPYMAFEPLPASMELNPSVDHWSTADTIWASEVTRQVSAPRSPAQVSRQAITRSLGTETTVASFLRQIEVTFEARDFGAGEIVQELTFDGISVMPPGGLVANAQGIVSGSFQIPPRVPVGTKQVRIVGTQSRGSTTFTGSGSTSITTLQITRTVAVDYVDPLAQTFSLQRAAQIAAVDLWFTAKGPTRVLVQLRETQLGFPTRAILAEVSLPTADIHTDGTHTRVTFNSPVALDADTEYALVVLCDDPTSALAIGVLGQFDAATQNWVTVQPYNVGVLLSSANASTWTAHQERDMAFRLHRAKFNPAPRTLDLGTVAVADATDLMLLAAAEVTSSDARISYALTLPGGVSVDVATGQPLRLAAPITGHVGVTARLEGTEAASPILHPGTQLLVGTVGAAGDYVTRAVLAGAGSRVRVVYELLAPAGSTSTLSYANGADDAANPASWAAMPVTRSTPVDNGWVEMTHEVTGVDHPSVRCKLQLSGTTAARPQARAFRMMVLEG